MAGPLVATVLCLLAARRSKGRDAGAWRLFGIGSGLYLAGNLMLLGFAALGLDIGFPAFPEIAFFVMAAFFAVGMARFGRAPKQSSSIRLLTFFLVYGAVATACLLLLQGHIQYSVMSEFATIVAFLYPALWFSVAAFGVMTLALYEQNEKLIPFLILLGAILAEAIADFRYALDLMEGTYTLGGPANLLWMASAFLICWAAVEQILKPEAPPRHSSPPSEDAARMSAQALIPATALGLIMLSGSMSGAFGGSPYTFFSAGLALALSAIIGLREYRLIAESRRTRKEITHLAHHDFLTGLANRLLFKERLSTAISEGPVAVLLIDLDHFKGINDAWGHSLGDAVLVEMAHKIRGCVGTGDLVCRFGGDEFAIIVSNECNPGSLDRLARRLLAAASQPHDIDGRRVSAEVSIGIAMTDGVADGEELLRRADIALYVVKRDGRGDFRFFEPEMEGGLRDRQALRADLALAVERGELELHYQAVVDLETHNVSAFEALLRWRHPDRGLVSPADFLPTAEESGLIVPIGEWVLHTACAAACRWPSSISVAVNLSTKQFRDALPQTIAASLSATGLTAGRLELEITESTLLQESEANLGILRSIGELGVRVALDDFGTGYSSLSYLQKFHFSKLKIDRAFVEGLPGSQESEAIVAAIVAMGKSLGMRITAEGVETLEQLDWLGGRCHEAQGFYLSRPVVEGEVPSVIAKLNTTER